MTTNHKPATPLPWTRDAQGIGNVLIEDLTGFTVAVFSGKRPTSTDNLAYARHAANAYPKLVARLLLLEATVDSALTFRRRENPARAFELALNTVRDEARALLHELGEAS